MLPSQSTIDAKLSAALQQSMHDHWRLFLIEGIVLCLLGLAAIVVPPIAGLVSTIFLGWLFLIAGVFGLLFTFRAKQTPGFWWSVLSAALAVVAGGFLLWNPLQGLVTLTYVLTAFFIADGIVTIALSIAHRRDLSGRWEWMLVNGVIDLILAGVIISGFPESFTWVLGLLVGIDMLFGGTSLIAMALDARRTAP